MQRSRSIINNENRFTSIPAEGSDDDAWAGRLLRQPVKDDGRRQRSTTAVPSGSELTTPVGYPNRWIVGPGPGIPSPWSTLIGQLVTWDGSAWVPEVQYVGQLVYSYKRDEYLELVDTIQNSIGPTLTPPIMVSSSGSVLRFWMPQSLLDSYQTAYKGTVTSLTTQSAVWSLRCYERNVIRSDDASFSAYGGYIATYVADILSNSGKWVFQPAKEGDFIWVEDANNFYYHNGTTWVVFAGGTGIAALYAAEGRPSSSASATMVLTAAASNTLQKVAFPYSAVLDLAVCPPSFFADGGNEFEAPRTGHYAVGFNAFYTVRDVSTVDQTLTFVIRVNGTTIPSGTFIIPNVDNYEGESFKCILKLNAGDLVTLEFKCEGADWAEDITIHNGPNLFIHTIDAVGNESGEHALNDHTDTDFPSPADGDTIVWDDGAGMWVSAAGPAPGPHTLGSHSDTTFSSLATNDVVKWDGSGWVNGPVAAGPHTIIGSSHSDSVATGSLANNQVLTYDSGLSKWTNKAVPVPALDNLSNVSTVGKAVGDFLWWTGAAWANRAIRLDDLFDVNAPTPATNQALIWNGLAWVPGNPTVAMAVPYWGGYLSLLSPPTWTAYSTGGGAYTLNRVGGPSGWIFWTPPVSGTYEMIVTGSITFTPGGSNGSFGIYLNNTGGPLGQPGIIGTSPLGSMTIAAHAVAYLSGGNVMGFAMSAGGGGSIGAVYLNLTIKRIGD